MPVFPRVASVHTECTPFVRSAGAWSDENDQLFARAAGENELIYPDPAAVGDLLPVEDFAVTAGPNHFSVTVGWTNPAQPTVTPTDLQIRIAELGAVWTEISVAATSWSWGALEASREYVAQIRYIRRENGIITDTSAVRSVSFTTTAAPIGAPAEDPGSPGGTDTIWPLGGNTGNPTPPATADGCWWEWKLQILDQDTTTINWQDTGITGTEDGDGENISYDTAALDNTRTYRLCIREACDLSGSDGVADDFGDWTCSAPFPGAFDWGVTCGAVPLAPVVELDAAADAVWAFPRYCAVGAGLDTTGIVDAISNTQIGKGADFAAMYADEDGEWGVVADADGGITLTAGLAAVVAAIGAGLDFSIAVRRRLSPGHTFSNGRTTTIASIGGGAIVFRAIETATGWYPTVTFRLTSGYVTLDASADELSEVGVIQTAVLRWDADGDKKLWFEGADSDEDVSGDDLHASVAVQPMYWTAEVGLGTTMQQIGWDRILTDEELGDTFIPTIEYVGAGAPSLASTGSDGLIVALPAGAQAGDFCVALAQAASLNDLIMVSTGWTLRYSIEAEGGPFADALQVWTKFLTSASDNPEFDITLTQPVIGRTMVFRNVKNPLVIEDQSIRYVDGNDTSSPTNGMAFGNVDVSTQGALMVLAAGSYSSTDASRNFLTFPTTTDWIEAFNDDIGPNSGWYQNLVGAYGFASTTGSRPTPNWLFSNALTPLNGRGGVILVLSPR